MDLPDHLLRLGCIEILPALEEFNEAVAIVKASCEERLHVLELACFHKLLEWPVSADQIRYTCLGVVEELRRGYSRFLAACGGANFWNLGVIDQVVITHEELRLRAELVGLEDAPLILLLVFQLKNEVEPGHFLPNFPVVAPADLV